MSAAEPPAYGTPDPREPVPPASGPRVFEARHQPREAIALVLVGGIGTAIIGAPLGLLSGLISSGDPLGGDPSATAPEPFRIAALGMLAFVALFGVMFLTMVTSGLVRALRRALIVRVDADGVLLQRHRWWRQDRFVPWDAIRGLSAYSTTRRSEDGTSTVHWFQVDLADGTIERRRLDRGRYSWALLADVVATVAPGTRLTVQGELPTRRGQ